MLAGANTRFDDLESKLDKLLNLQTATNTLLSSGAQRVDALDQNHLTTFIFFYFQLCPSYSLVLASNMDALHILFIGITGTTWRFIKIYLKWIVGLEIWVCLEKNAFY